MPSLQIISSCLQLVESPLSKHRARRSKRVQKSLKATTSLNCVSFSPRIALLEPIDSDRDTTPLLGLNASYFLSSISFAKPEACLPVLPALPSPPHPNIAQSEAKSNSNHQSQTIPFVKIHGAVSHGLDFSDAIRLSERAVDQAIMPESPSLTPTAFHNISDSSNSGSRVEKDEHEIYLNSLRLLHFGGAAESAVMGDDLSSSLIHQHDDWEVVDLQNYGWQE